MGAQEKNRAGKEGSGSRGAEGGGFTQGARYRLVMKDGTVHDGIFISGDDSFIYLKLSSGYNIGVLRAAIESRLETGEATEAWGKIQGEQYLPVHDPEIVILHAGGTIASRVDYETGAVTPRFSTEEILSLFPELKDVARIESRYVANLLSGNLNFSHYNLMAEAVAEALKGKSVKGIILTHGTDTLHYTAAALSFSLGGVPVPVVLVGAQRSSDRPSSDAALNLLSAALFISKSGEHGLRGVFACMHGDSSDESCLVLPGVNLRKLHSSKRDTFRVINGGPLARVSFEKGTVEVLPDKGAEWRHEKEKMKEGFSVRPFNPALRVGILRARPGLRPEEVGFYHKYDGLILEGTGLGHFPVEAFDDATEANKEIYKEIEVLAREKIVCMTTQAVFGRVNMDVYSYGRLLKDAGVLGHGLDMATETAYVKLAWLLSNYPVKEAKRLYSENLRGEVSDRSGKEEFE
jgi:glutamyl-tRNA(Gln) amidotransferase subunit D